MNARRKRRVVTIKEKEKVADVGRSQAGGKKKIQRSNAVCTRSQNVQVLVGDDTENVTEGGSTHANTLTGRRRGGKAG